MVSILPLRLYCKSNDNINGLKNTLSNAKLAQAIACDLLDEGIYVISFSYPVPRQARIRVQVSATHAQEQLNRCVEAFVRLEKRYKAIEG